MGIPDDSSGDSSPESSDSELPVSKPRSFLDSSPRSNLRSNRLSEGITTRPSNVPRAPPSYGSQSAIHDGVLTTNPRPNCDHIKLERLNVYDIFQFQLHLSEYKALTGIRLRAAPRVSEHVRSRVLTCEKVNMTDPLEFLQLSEKKLNQYLQRTIRPPTVPDFSQMLKRSVRFKTREGFVLSDKKL